jgi:hypothetical protein
MWGEDDELDEAECDETIKSNIRVLDRILNNTELDCVALAFRFEFNIQFCAEMAELKPIGEENNVLASLLRYVLEVKDIGILTAKIQLFLRHLALEFNEMQDANNHVINELVTHVAIMFKIFTQSNWIWDIEEGCKRRDGSPLGQLEQQGLVRDV